MSVILHAHVSDEDPTPRLNRSRIQTSEDRDLAARRARSRSHVFGVPILPPPTAAREAADDLTSPFDLLEREPDHEVQAVVERATRNGDDPATFADVVKLAVALTRERTGNQQREREAEQVLRAPREATRSSRRYLIATVIAAAASIASPIVRPGERPPAGADQLREQFQHEIDRLDAELRAVREQLGRRSERIPLVPAGASPALTVITQGTHP